MHRPFRFAPPHPGLNAVERPRLASALAERFDRRLVTVEAGAGFGKTTLLAQALGSGTGIDAYVSCDSGDTTPSRLLGAILTALGSAPGDDTMPSVNDVAETAWALSPRRVCIVLDDLHRIDPTAPTIDVVSALLDELPDNASMVWAGRRLPPRGQARLLALGQANRLTEADLALTADELAEMAHAHGLAVDLFADLGGWPALAELTASSGRAIAARFVDDEILSRLNDEDRFTFVAAVAVGGGDAELISAAAGRPVDLQRLAALPLVSYDRAIGIRPHHLWAEMLDDTMQSSEVVEARRRAVGVLLGRQQFADAYEILSEAGDWAAALDVLVEGCNDQSRPPWGDLLARWRRLVPPAFADRAEVIYLDAMIERVTDPWSTTCRLQFDRAIKAFLAAGQPARAHASAVRATYVDWICGYSDRQRRAIGQAQAAVDRGLARPELVAITAAALGDITGNTMAVRSFVRPGMSIEARLDHFAPLYLAFADLLDGDPLKALRFARLAQVAADPIYPAGGSGFARLVPSVAAWASGTLLAADDAALADPGPRLPLPERVPFLAMAAIVAAHRLDGERAERYCEMIATLTRDPEDRGLLAAARAVASAVLACSHGDENGAVEALKRLDSVPFEAFGAGRILAWFPAVPYLFNERCRAWLDSLASVGRRRAVLDACRALLAARSDGTVSRLEILELDDLLLTSLPPPLAVELVIAAAAAGHLDAEERLHRLAESHPVVSRRQIVTAAGRETAGRGSAVARLRRAVAFAPAQTLHITALGPLRVCHGEVVVDHRDLRRERVRQLIGVLVLHRSVRREHLGLLLWPEFDDAAVSANLRQTLSYLHGVLEPERDKGGAPWFVRQTAGTLHLRDDTTIDVDAWRVEAHLDAADRATADGSPTRQLAELRAALAGWTGELLPDLVDAPWAAPARQRMHDRLVRAAVRAGELLIATARHDEARSIAERAIAAEPWAEAVHRVVISACLAAGDRAGAHRAAERCRAALGDIGVELDARTAALVATL